MEKSRNNFIILTISILVFFSGIELYAESPYKKIVYNAFISREMHKWANVIYTIEISTSSQTIEQKLELVDYYYGYAAFLIGKKQNESALKYIDKGEKTINTILKSSPNNASAYAYKGAFIGFRIGISKFKAIYLGPESASLINKAYELDKKNVQANIDKGNILYYSPSIFGGDKIEALEFYKKAIKLMENNNEIKQSWTYLNLLTTIALAYEKTDQPAHAKQTYEKILRIEPDFYWVKVDLYPKFLAKNKL